MKGHRFTRPALAGSKNACRILLAVAAAGLLVVAIRADVTAQDSASEGIVPPPAGTDVEMLRKLLGLPPMAGKEQPPAAAPAAPAAQPEAKAAPEPAPPTIEPAPAAKSPSRPKAVAKPPAKKPSRPVVKAAPKKPASPVAEKQEEPKPQDPAAAEAAAPPPAEDPAPADTRAEDASAAEGAPAEGSSGDVPVAGTIIDASNLERWKHLLGPSIQWAVSRGATLPVVDPIPTPLEPFREEATQRYSAQVTLTADRNAMKNYVAGVPFPLVTDDDPDVAIKMMFNLESRLVVDDVAVRNFSCDTGRIEPKAGLQVERHYVVDAFRRLFYVSRFHVDPKPTWPTPDGVRYREMLGHLHEPFDLKGAGFTYTRYLDPARHDDSWLYFPQLKRVRRLSTSQRSEGVFGQDIDLDSYAGYAGNPAWSHWTYLGKKTILGVMNARNLPAKFQGTPAEFFPDDVWEPREVYVLLAVSKLGGYNFGQRVLYVDRQSLLIPYTEIYDLKGALWKGLVQTWKLDEKPVAWAKKAVYGWKQFYIPSLSMFDIQLDHVTRCFLPSPDEKGEEGWYYNFGTAEGTTEEVFSVSHFIETGR